MPEENQNITLEQLNTFRARDQLDVLGETDYMGSNWALYSDGSYRHVVPSSALEELMFDYTDWCCEHGGADDVTSVVVAFKLGFDCVNSCGGTCELLPSSLDALAEKWGFF